MLPHVLPRVRSCRVSPQREATGPAVSPLASSLLPAFLGVVLRTPRKLCLPGSKAVQVVGNACGLIDHRVTGELSCRV